MMIKVTWEVDDGYVGKSAPHTLTISEDELQYCESEEIRQEYIEEAVDSDFAQTVTWTITSIEKV